MNSCRECAGLPLHTPTCPLCAVLCRLGEIGHRGVFTTSNLEAFVTRLRLLHSEALDVVDSKDSAVAAARSSHSKPPGTWEGASPAGKVKNEGQQVFSAEDQPTKVKDTTSRTPSTTRVKKPGTTREPSLAPVFEKKSQSPVKEQFIEVSVEEGESGEEELLEDDSEVLPECEKCELPGLVEEKATLHSSKGKNTAQEEEHEDVKKEGADQRERDSRERTKRSRRKASRSRRASKRKRLGSEDSRGDRKRPVLRPKSPSHPPPRLRARRGFDEFLDWDRRPASSRTEDRPTEGWKGWKNSGNPAWKRRSKGVVRAQRWKDIREFGPNRERHYQRW